jgi:hypothetical protein
MKTAELATFPDAAVTVPETSYVPEPVTVVGETVTVTASEAATAASGATRRNARSRDAQTAALNVLIVSASPEGRYI